MRKVERDSEAAFVPVEAQHLAATSAESSPNCHRQELFDPQHLQDHSPDTETKSDIMTNDSRRQYFIGTPVHAQLADPGGGKSGYGPHPVWLQTFAPLQRRNKCEKTLNWSSCRISGFVATLDECLDPLVYMPHITTPNCTGLNICDTIHEKVPSLSSGVKAFATCVNDF